jgi:hypothetical protein
MQQSAPEYLIPSMAKSVLFPNAPISQAFRKGSSKDCILSYRHLSSWQSDYKIIDAVI